jgi:hypothetical protein
MRYLTRNSSLAVPASGSVLILVLGRIPVGFILGGGSIGYSPLIAWIVLFFLAGAKGGSQGASTPFIPLANRKSSDPLLCPLGVSAPSCTIDVGTPDDATLTVLPFSFSHKAELPWLVPESLREVVEAKGSELGLTFACACSGPFVCTDLSDIASASSGCDEDNTASNSEFIL